MSELTYNSLIISEFKHRGTKLVLHFLLGIVWSRSVSTQELSMVLMNKVEYKLVICKCSMEVVNIYDEWSETALLFTQKLLVH